MDNSNLERLAIQEIIAEIEKKKQFELQSQQTLQRPARPNKRFLGRTILSVLQHNRRQHAREMHNSSKKFRELDRRARKARSKSKELQRSPVRRETPERCKTKANRKMSAEECEPIETGAFFNPMPVDLTMFLLSNMNQVVKTKQEIKKAAKKKKQKTQSILTIDLTTKKKRKKHKKKQKALKKKIKSKKRKRRKRSSSSSSSSSRSSSSSSRTKGNVRLLSDSETSSSDGDDAQASSSLIDLT